MAEPKQRNPVVLRAMLFLVLGLLLIPAGIYLPSSPWKKERMELEAARTQLSAMRAKTTRVRMEQGQLTVLQGQVAAMDANLASSNQALPAGKQADDFIRALEKVAAESGIVIKRITSKPVVSEPYHSDLPFEIEVTGSYAGTVKFLEGIGRMPRVTNVGDMTLGGFADPNSRPRNAPPNATVAATILLVTYFSPQGASAPVVMPAAAKRP